MREFIRALPIEVSSVSCASWRASRQKTSPYLRILTSNECLLLDTRRECEPNRQLSKRHGPSLHGCDGTRTYMFAAAYKWSFSMLAGSSEYCRRQLLLFARQHGLCFCHLKGLISPRLQCLCRCRSHKSQKSMFSLSLEYIFSLPITRRPFILSSGTTPAVSTISLIGICM